MRARAGDPARNMPQKILAGRAEDPSLSGDLIRVRVDQVILAEDPMRVLSALSPTEQSQRFAVETAVAYDPRCINIGAISPSDLPQETPLPVDRDLVRHGLAIGRAGIGFPSAVHLERFAAPARLALTDNPRLAGLGGAGMLTLLASTAQLQTALHEGMVCLRPPRSVQVLLSGKLRPFVGARDLALELLLRGLETIVQDIDKAHDAPVVLEFAGPSARLLSISDRALLCSLAPRVGASAGIFLSDEKTEVYLRDQRRSKAFRGLTPDAGAPCDNVLTVDLSTVDPLVLDSQGQVRPIRELEGQPIHQAIVGGDAGSSIRDTLAVATLLKSKRVPPDLDFLVACASRQTLEVMAQSEALVDLLATGARLIEPDPRLLLGELYQPAAGTLSMRTFDSDTPASLVDNQCIVASPDAVALAVATGHVGDPRTFKRPVRITIPRTLPTEDVLVLRKPRGKDNTGSDLIVTFAASTQVLWSDALTLQLRREDAVGAPGGASAKESENTSATSEANLCQALIASCPKSLQQCVAEASRLSPSLRVVVAEHIPSGLVSMLASCGIVALTASAEQLQVLRSHQFASTAPPNQWAEHVTLTMQETTMALSWPANEEERSWTLLGGSPHTVATVSPQ